MQKVVYKRRVSKYNISTIAATEKNTKMPRRYQGVVMAKYKKCPRCEINYILENEDYCEICKQELKGARLSADLDADEEESEESDLCPVCHKNYLNEGEKICSACASAQYEKSSLNDDIDEEEPEEPEEDLDSTNEDDWELSLEEMQDEEFADDAFGDEEKSEDDEYEEEEEEEKQPDEDDDVPFDDSDDEEDEEEPLDDEE